jgi:hypothetical protein
MMKLRILRTITFSIFFLLSGFALAHAQASPAPDAPSRLSLFVHDFTTWLDHVGGTGVKHNRVVSHSPPMPRPRPVERASAVASNQELSEFAPAPVASQKKTPTPVQIRD